MTVIITITFDAARDKRDALVERLTAILPDTRAFDGCESISFSESEASPGSFLLVEEWETMEHFVAYKKWRVESGTTVLGSDLVENAVQNSFAPLSTSAA